MTDSAFIKDFLAQRRLALVGASTHEKDFSRVVMRELIAHGYDVVPVRPGATEIEGRPAYARLQDVPGALGGAIIMTPPEATAQIVHDAANAGVPRVWMHRGAGRGAVDPGAVAFCREQGIAVVVGECPLMFVGDESVHRIHGAARRAAGSYPRAGLAEMPRRPDLLPLAAHALVGWLACAAVMALLMALVDRTAALVLHALAAPAIFAPIAAHYARRRPTPAPLATAAFFVAVVALLDAIVVAGIVLRDFSMFASLLGTWIPFALIFIASVIAATRVVPTVRASV